MGRQDYKEIFLKLTKDRAKPECYRHLLTSDEGKISQEAAYINPFESGGDMYSKQMDLLRELGFNPKRCFTSGMQITADEPIEINIMASNMPLTTYNERMNGRLDGNIVVLQFNSTGVLIPGIPISIYSTNFLIPGKSYSERENNGFIVGLTQGGLDSYLFPYFQLAHLRYESGLPFQKFGQFDIQPLGLDETRRISGLGKTDNGLVLNKEFIKKIGDDQRALPIVAQGMLEALVDIYCSKENQNVELALKKYNEMWDNFHDALSGNDSGTSEGKAINKFAKDNSLTEGNFSNKDIIQLFLSEQPGGYINDAKAYLTDLARQMEKNPGLRDLLRAI